MQYCNIMVNIDGKSLVVSENNCIFAPHKTIIKRHEKRQSKYKRF